MKTTVLTLAIIFITSILNADNPKTITDSEDIIHYSNVNYYFQQVPCCQMFLGSTVLYTATLSAVFLELCDPLSGICGGDLDVMPLIDGFVIGASARNKLGLPSTAHCVSQSTISYSIRFEVGLNLGGGFIPYQYINRSGYTSSQDCCG